jgi:hypothetical protein
VIELIDRVHVISHVESVLLAVELELFKRPVEGHPIVYSLVNQILPKMDDVAVLPEGVLLYYCYQIDDHLRLRTARLLTLII